MLAGREFGKGVTKEKTGWDDLKNSLVFTWGFVEMLVWFWVSDTNVSSDIQFWELLQNFRQQVKDCRWKGESYV